jgi:hypothetical protein
MNTSGQQQTEFDFQTGFGNQGFIHWQEQRRQVMERLTTRMGLPLGHLVEVWLEGGVRLRGMLRLQEEKLFVEDARDFSLVLTVDKTPFTAGEIQSCIRLD